MYLFPNCDDGRNKLIRRLFHYADLFSTEYNVDVTMERGIVIEAFGSAYGSAQFHQIPLADISHYKELAHIGYWIAELKPFRIDPPLTPGYLLDKASVLLGRALLGTGAATEAADRSYNKAERNYRKVSDFPISEHIALQFVADSIEIEFQRKLSLLEKSDPDNHRLALGRFERFQHILYDKPTFENIVKALRFHVFTPRSFATLIESVFSFEGL